MASVVKDPLIPDASAHKPPPACAPAQDPQAEGSGAHDAPRRKLTTDCSSLSPNSAALDLTVMQKLSLGGESNMGQQEQDKETQHTFG